MDADQCVHCGLCLTACPTYEATGLEVESPRGRLVLLQEWATQPSSRDSAAAGWLDDCLDCRACELVCPANIPTGHLVEEWRTNAPQSNTNKRVMWILRVLMGSRRGLIWLERLSRWGRSRWGRWALTITHRNDLSQALAELSDGLPPANHHQLSRHLITSDPGPGADMLFVGCVMDALYATTNAHTASLLHLAGRRVTVPVGQSCCGALHVHGGDSKTARKWAQHNIRAFEISASTRVIVNAAGCGTTLKEYPHLFPNGSDWQARAQRFSDSVSDVLEVFQESPLPQLSPNTQEITVHDACHHTAQKIQNAPRILLQRSGFTIREMADSTRCCGSAGVYNLTHLQMSRTLAKQKIADIPSGVRMVAAANPGCILQIQAGAMHYGRDAVQVRHPVDLVYEAYRRAGYLGGDANV